MIVAGAAALAHREPPPSIAEMAPPAPQVISVAATKTDRADRILDAAFSYSRSEVAFRASSDIGPLLDVEALHGPEPRTIRESRRLRAAFLPPAAPPILVVAALPAPPTPTEGSPDEPQIILAEPEAEAPVAEMPLTLPPEPEVVVSIPAPVPRPDIDIPAAVPAVRPAEPARADTPQQVVPRRVATTRTAAAPEADEPPVDKSSIFQRLFSGRGKVGAELAYASIDKDDTPTVRSGSGMPNWFSSSTKATAGTAVYDISASTVYLPNGERLEAHSGFGDKRDNPRYVNVKMKGATPPHTYDLTERESLFHGVQALRLTPVGGNDAVHGRVGLLAHTYMLGPRGDSNGCVSFKDYNRFLQAYRRGEIRRLVVVASR